MGKYFFIVGEKRESFKYPLTGGCLHQDAGGRVTRRGTFYAIGLRSIFVFSGGPELEIGTKIREAGSHWLFCTDCYGGCSLASYSGCCKSCVRALLSLRAWPLSIFIFSLSEHMNLCIVNFRSICLWSTWTIWLWINCCFFVYFFLNRV